MARRKVDKPTRISIMIPADLLGEVDNWKKQIEDVSRSELVSKLVRYALERNAVDELYPDTIKGLKPPVDIERSRLRAINQNIHPKADLSLRETPNFQRTIKEGPHAIVAHPLTPRERLSNPTGKVGIAEPRAGEPPLGPSLGYRQELGAAQAASLRGAGPLPVAHHGGEKEASGALQYAPAQGSDHGSAWNLPSERKPSLRGAGGSKSRPVLSPEEFLERMAQLQRRVEQI